MSYFQLCLLSWWYYFQRLGHECTPTPQRTPFFSPLFPAFIPSFIPVSAHNKSLPNSSDKSLFHHFLCPVHVCVLSCFNCIILCATLWTVALQAPLSMGFSRQEYWSGLPCPPPGDLPHPGIEPVSLMSPTLADGFFNTNAAWEAPIPLTCLYISSWYLITN